MEPCRQMCLITLMEVQTFHHPHTCPSFEASASWTSYRDVIMIATSQNAPLSHPGVRYLAKIKALKLLGLLLRGELSCWFQRQIKKSSFARRYSELTHVKVLLFRDL